MSAENRVHIKLESGPLIPTPSHQSGEQVGCGAEVSFLGRTRAEHHPEFGHLVALEYESHPTLAMLALETIGHELLNTHQLELIAIRHATGHVPVGCASVEIRILSPHRAHAFTACSEAMDRIKSEVAIWKQECWETGKTWSTSARPLSVGESE